MTSTQTSHRVGCFVGVLSLGLANVGFSAEPSAPSHAVTSADTGLEEVVVTAQRRSEDLRNVPISMTAITPEQLETFHLQDLASLPMVTPDLNFTQGINFTQTYIRGIGSGLVNAGLEGPVATYIDGGYVSREFGGLYDILDPSSVEVLKGPQGSLYGRNATGGVLLITTADPTANSEGHLDAEVGNIGHQKLEGVVNLPISDTLDAHRRSLSL
jgi:iron complex outermembrane recepter protein